MKIVNKIKLYLLKRLYIWWGNESDGRYLRGTKANNEVIDLLFKNKRKKLK